ncbi:hypothetical protein EJ04DRAFT_560111 [Polyplosphaeria fusca]|uniref:Uncharacterized protein n=1 Tax=Polyplosphaeria fusca TaxID=682080 RepID=A0A9P4R9J7_9PLEO|nr:hypothetical protein EJ04DRAFT_560111 [Polyplosphaeria fusca]
MAELSVYDNDPTLYLFTSLTAGSSHIVTATSRIETILKANKIPFKGVDTATDELARKLYGRRARGKKLPLLVKEGFVVADLEQVEEWNEYDELKEALGVTAALAPAKPTPAASTTASKPEPKKENIAPASSEQNLAIRQMGAEAAAVAASKKATPSNINTTNPLLSQKVNSPATSTPTKPKADPSGILSPRSIPLPETPKTLAPSTDGTLDTSSIPSPTQKGVKQPPSMHIDAPNPALDAGPVKVSQASPSAKSPPITSPARTSSSDSGMFHGSKVETPSEEEIKQIEKAQTIPEVSSSDEEEDDDEDDDDDDESESDKKADVDTKNIGSQGADAAKGGPVAKGAGKGAEEVEEEEEDEEDEDDEDEDEDESEEDTDDDSKPQAQSAKAADKAGVSVKD